MRLALLRDAADAQSSGRPGPPRTSPAGSPARPRRGARPAPPAAPAPPPPGARARPAGRPGRDRRAHVVLAGRRRPPRPADAVGRRVCAAAWPIRTARGPGFARRDRGRLALGPGRRPSPRRAGTTSAGRAERTLVLAVLRGALLDLLATGDVARTTGGPAPSARRAGRFTEARAGQYSMRAVLAPGESPAGRVQGPSRLVLGLDASPETAPTDSASSAATSGISWCCPPATTVRPLVTTWPDVGGARARRPLTPGRCPGRVPAACGGVSSATVTRSAKRTGRDQTGVRPAQAGRGRRRVARRAAARAAEEVATLLGGQPLAQLDPPGLLQQVDDRLAVAAQGQRAARRGQGRAAGPIPSARSASVVGQKHA